ncbi:MAG: [protein-PII] uridylyltransferase [Gammaproteobacteria bacterium]|nr:[protein-PII] uridylyltransferase [Gammaproteobacteria bacterium]MBL6999481.1 [protein-PII] uridylyltransferase [Gammaproteobacteria bacterium]
MPLSSLDWLDQILAQAGTEIKPISSALKQATDLLNKSFTPTSSADLLVRQKSNFVDHVLTHCFHQFLDGEMRNTCALLAVGGYGRAELLPASDIDLMILLNKKADKELQQKISSFLTFLWDIGLEVGSSVRTLKECVQEGKIDVTVMTNMIESRLITGDAPLYAKYKLSIAPKKMWSSRAFFAAKLEEQKKRHQRFNDTAYNLEPNIKEGPGGLRDIQIIGWVAKRHYGARTLKELVDHEFLTEREYQALIDGQTHLWRVRFALHRLTGRREDRLLFEYQKQLAECFGYSGGENNLAIEQFMQKYYRTIMELERLNEMLLQLLHQEIFYKRFFNKTEKLNEDFTLHNGYIEAVSDQVFINNPSALIEIFILMQTRPDIQGPHAVTIRLIRQSLHLIDEDFRTDPKNTELFMRFMRKPVGIIHQLRRMNRYGVLAAYIPVFEKIVGRMQYDLFHAYTVDQHTLFVIRNLRRFSVEEHRHEFPHCSAIHDQLEKPELLYLAGLFHDIAKGRGGDHSVLGAEDVEQFSLLHGLNRKDTRVISQLVRKHLLMSTTAQRKDIGDPEVVHQFAREVGSESMLDYLYLLTVADIRATNPRQWNNWKGSLISELFYTAKKVLRQGLEQAPDIDEIINENREAACDLISQTEYTREQIEALCAEFPGDYFLHHKAEEITWHVSSIMSNAEQPSVVNIRQSTHSKATEIFIHTIDTQHVFSRVVGVLSSMNLDILHADIYTTRDNQTLDTFIIQDSNANPLSNQSDIELIRDTLIKALDSAVKPEISISKRMPRQLKSFNSPSQINFSQDILNHRTILEVITVDRPGLLYAIANKIAEVDLQVTHAKISTLGEKVEDIFYLTDEKNRAITNPETLDLLRQKILSHLDKKTTEQADSMIAIS